MTVMIVVALTVFALLIGPRFRVLLHLKRDMRFNQIPKRLINTLKFALGQWRMPRDFIAGIAHIFIFSGFLVVAIATITHFVHAYDPKWHLPGLGGRAGQIYILIKDIFEILVLIGVIYGLWRRLKPHESRVGRSWEGIFVLGMIFTLMITDFLTFGGELLARNGCAPCSLDYSPAGATAAMLLAPLGVDTAHFIGVASWWIHCTLILVFLNFLPIGKHFHVITAFPNVFFKTLRPYGQIEKINLEEAEEFGIRSTADLTWHMALNTYSCTECGRCNMYCPTKLTDKPLSHRQLNLDLKHALAADRKTIISGDKEAKSALPELVGERISPDTIWACTTCGSCETECPVLIEQTPRIIGLRQHKVLMEGDVAPELARAFKGIEQNQNPWGLGSDQRDTWAEGLDIPRIADVAGNGETPLLYWVGCAGSFDDRAKKVSVAMVNILRAAGVNFAILGKEEGCTGDSARRAGNEYLFAMMAETNVELLNNYKVKKILVTCPHCFHTFSKEYPQFGGNYEVMHHTTLINELIASGKLKLKNTVTINIAYHDSCYLGRYQNNYNDPREVIAAVPGATLVELPRNKSRAVCCGAGGARFWLEEKIGERINVHRAREAVACNTDTIGTNCPFCLTMLKDGVAALDKDDNVKVLDLAEIVAQALSTKE
ncbi:MAG: (Fe-S)-binding protein [Deltaproteobacteria bacterium]|nr:(Fe-S)-binding protein [Deltaproteobacteria bacterium]